MAAAIQKAPRNEAPWRYLTGLFAVLQPWASTHRALSRCPEVRCAPPPLRAMCRHVVTRNLNTAAGHAAALEHCPRAVCQRASLGAVTGQGHVLSVRLHSLDHCGPQVARCGGSLGTRLGGHGVRECLSPSSVRTT